MRKAIFCLFMTMVLAFMGCSPKEPTQLPSVPPNFSFTQTPLLKTETLTPTATSQIISTPWKTPLVTSLPTFPDFDQVLMLGMTGGGGPMPDCEYPGYVPAVSNGGYAAINRTPNPRD